MGLFQCLLSFVAGRVPLSRVSSQEQAPAARPGPNQRRTISKDVLAQLLAPKPGIRKRPGAKRKSRTQDAVAYMIATVDGMAGGEYTEWHRAYCDSVEYEPVPYSTFRLRAQEVVEKAEELLAGATDVASDGGGSSSSSSSSSQQETAWQQAGSTLLRVPLPPHLTVAKQREVYVAALMAAIAQVDRGCGVSLQRWLVSWDTAAIEVYVRCCPGAAPLLLLLHVGGLIRPDGSGSLKLLPSIWQDGSASQKLKGIRAQPACPRHTAGLRAAAATASQGPYDAEDFVEQLPALVEAAAQGLPPLPAPTATAAAELLSQLRLPIGPFKPAAAGSAASRVILLVDGATQHTAAVSAAKIQEQGLLVVQTPPDSRDLNPIEDCWMLFKRLLQHRVLTARNQQELLAQLNTLWSSKEVRTTAAAAMQGYAQRLQRVIDSNYERLPGYCCRG